MSILGIIPARGGSKGLPGKNILDFNGKPLISWTIEAALKSQSLDRIIVSTDDEKIASVSIAYGAEVPFLRPSEIAQDHSATIDTVLHAIDSFKNYEYILLLQPTSPLRSSQDIQDIIKYGLETKASSIVSVCVSAKHPRWMYEFGKKNVLQPIADMPFATRRQDMGDVYELNGALYFFRAEWIKKSKAFIDGDTLGFIMPKKRSIDIDTALDFEIAKHLQLCSDLQYE